jgi:hypothetical protein
MSPYAVLRSTLLFALSVLLLAGCPEGEGDADELDDLTEAMCMHACKSDADCGKAQCIATSDGSTFCAAPECRACWAQGPNYTCRFDPENGCGFDKCGIVICGPRKPCSQSGGEQCAPGTQCLQAPGGTSMCLPPTCASCYANGQDCTFDSMSCQMDACVPRAPSSSGTTPNNGGTASTGSTGSTVNCTCSKALPQCPAGTSQLASIPGRPVAGQDCCSGSQCLGYDPPVAACATYCGSRSGTTSGGTTSGGPSTSGGTTSGGTTSGSTSGGRTSATTHDGGIYNNCISFFYDRDRYNWYSFRNNCSETLHVTYGLKLQGGLSATDVAAGGKQSTGWDSAYVTKGGGVNMAVCRAGYIPVLSSGAYWTLGSSYSCKKQ